VELCKKKEENCIAPYCQTREIGDAYTYLGIKRKSFFMICFVVGKWNDHFCNKFYEKLAFRMRFPTTKRKITILSDGNKQNNTAIKNNFPSGTVNYGCKKKIRLNQKIVGVVNSIRLGYFDRNKISITNIDGFCSKLRERISCFTRKARTYPKRKWCLESRLEIFSIQHNFIEKKNGKTPAMFEGLINKPLSWNSFFNIRLTTLN